MVISLQSLLDADIRRENMENEQNISVSVRHPIMHYTWDNGHYTSYAIHVETKHFAFSLERSVVRRRFSEFVNLRSLVGNQHPTIVPPRLPPKSFFATHSDDFIEKRKLGLETFLQKLMENTMYVSNRSVHLFLQSSYPMHKIARMVGCSNEESHVMEPHLSLSLISPDEEYLMQSYNADVPDFDILGTLHDSPDLAHFYENHQSTICHRCGLQRRQTRVSQGSLITFFNPSQKVNNTDEYCNGHFIPENYDSDSVSLGTPSSSVDNTPTRNIPALIPSSSSECSLRSESCKTTNILQPLIRKKKVSFCSEVTVAQILNHDED